MMVNRKEESTVSLWTVNAKNTLTPCDVRLDIMLSMLLFLLGRCG